MYRRGCLVVATGLVASIAGCSAIPGDESVPGSDGNSGDDDGGEENQPNSGEGNQSTTDSEEDGANGEDVDDGGVEVELEENEPGEVVETFYDALYAPDVEMANELLHSDSPSPQYTEEAVNDMAEFDHEVSGLDITEVGDGEATADFVLVLVGEDGVERENEPELELQTEDGDWKVWDSVW